MSDIALKAELPKEMASSLAAYVGCIAGAMRIEDYRSELLKAGFEFVEIVDSGADLNAYAKVENQSGCCSPAMDQASSPFPIARVPAAHHRNRACMMTCARFSLDTT